MNRSLAPRPIPAVWLTTVLVAAGCAQEFGIATPPPGQLGSGSAPSLEPTVQEDVLVQRIPDALDVLWVVDNSSSMLAEQDKLARNFPRFLDFFFDSGLDWRVGVVSTDMKDPDHSGKLQGADGWLWVDDDTPDVDAVFREMVSLGRDGALVEEGRAAIHAALVDPVASAYNEGFYRADADLAVIVVSDEDDHSRGPAMEEFLAFLDVLKPEPEQISVSAIVTLDTPCGPNETGTAYREVVAATGGNEHDICDNDWRPILDDLGVRAAGLSRTFFLSRVPDTSTLEVWVDDGDAAEPARFEPGEGLDYDPMRNAVVFRNYTPPARAEIAIRYVVLEQSAADSDDL